MLTHWENKQTNKQLAFVYTFYMAYITASTFIALSVEPTDSPAEVSTSALLQTYWIFYHLYI